MENNVLQRDENSTKVEDENLTDTEVPDVSSLHIKSRLSPQTICENTDKPRANGLQQINGVYASPKLNFDSQTPDTPRTVDTSRLNQLHKTETTCIENEDSDIIYVSYSSELQMPDIMKLIQKDLSEPYSIYTYRYFIHNWPKLCFLAMHEEECIGAIVCKLDIHRKVIKRGYIAMLAVDVNYRKRKIGSSLVRRAIRAMVEDDADEVVLETEITNRPALKLYENLGFVRDKRLFRYYLNGVDALRLKLWLR
ncbi:N-alpha-acetyltransferase 30 isoform X2 [Fopius arisanus]|uniref:N-terminal methionine N(alpha)-acetyltransferase NatC n=1 Tax=Fopius arisanus TaxID=64838 RepID=A0A9R1TF07_9HYME|nr:PREDICTED: N-alpha-acetyltransferase 30 isoform X2 [Fopius arisanus]